MWGKLPRAVFRPHYSGSESFASIGHRLESLLGLLIKRSAIEAKSDAKSLSIPLLARSLLQNHDLAAPSTEYLAKKCLEQLEISDTSEDVRAWILGRVFLAGKPAEDEVVSMLKGTFQGKTKDETVRCWARSYAMESLARCNSNLYSDYRDCWLELSLAEIDKSVTSNRGWTLVCALSAAAEASDTSAFTKLSELGISGAVANINEDDYRAWAYGNVALAAAKIGDAELFSEMTDQRDASCSNAKDAGNLAVALALHLTAEWIRSGAADDWRVSVPFAFAAINSARTNHLL